MVGTIPTLLALVALLTWGLWALSAKVATRTVSPEVTMVLTYGMAAAFTLAYVVLGPPSLDFGGFGVWFALLGGVFLGAGSVAYYAGLKHGRAGIVTTLTALYFVVVLAFSALYFQEPITLRKLGGMTSAVVAIVLLVR